jgi:DNA invertase Pin-like site-specific DNA recombinase
MSKTTTTVTAYSYVRFSTKPQSLGDSLRRQADLAADYCERHGWKLSPASYRDLGVSARRGKNALVGNLGQFLKAIEAGSIRPGQALIVESLDRITRQGIDEGYDLIKRILKASILLVTLSPERVFDISATRSLSKGALEIQLILERAAEENERRSERVGAAWMEKKRRARDGELQRPTVRMGPASRCLTRMLPEWLRWEDGAIVSIPERVAVVKRMFALSAAGYGAPRIVKTLTVEGVKPWAGPTWLKTYVAKIIRDRRALGEYQPKKHDKPDGPPVADYYPAVVTAAEWNAANAGVLVRGKLPGRTGKTINLFAGLLHNARQPGDKYIASFRLSGRRPGKAGTPQRVLVTSSYSQGSGQPWSFPLEPFEQAVCSVLHEIDPAELFPPEKGREPSAADRIEAELRTNRDTRANLTAALRGRHVQAVVDELAELEAENADLERRLAEARMAEVHPPAASYREAQDLIDALDKAPDPADARLRLRAALRRILEKITLLVVPYGRDRLCDVLLCFQAGEKPAFKSFTIYHRAAVANATGVVAPARTALTGRLLPERAADPVWSVTCGGPYDRCDLHDPAQVKDRIRELEALTKDRIDRVFELYERVRRELM